MRTSADLLSSVLGQQAPAPSVPDAARAPAAAGMGDAPDGEVRAGAGRRRTGIDYRRVTLSFPDGLMRRLKVAAAAEGTSVSAVLTELAEGWLESRG